MMHANGRRFRARSTWIFALISAALGACTLEPGGPEYGQLSVYAENERGLVTDAACTTLPVMPGGVIVRELKFAAAFSAKLEAERDGLSLRFDGIREADDFGRKLSLERLRQGYAEELAVETFEGEAYSVFLSAPCEEAP